MTDDDEDDDELQLIADEAEVVRRRSVRHRLWRASIAVLAVLSVAVTIARPVTALIDDLKLDRDRRDAPVAVPTTSNAPPSTIRPLSVRPVITAFVTTPNQCPPPPLDPPDQPTRVCDIPKTAVYELGPEVLRMELTNVDSYRNPLTGAETVKLTMAEESAKTFGQFSAAQVGKQVAFVRQGTVVWGPKISEPIDSRVLELSGDLTADQATTLAQMLRDDS